MTPKKEDYLKIIFELGGRTHAVSNKQIALSLNIAPGSVTEMVRKLVSEGLVNHEPYAGISLTSKGIKVAEEMIRRHRLWESFLVNDLKYNLADVHSDAEVLEHITSDRLMDKLDDFLNHPKECPHGGVIPTKDGEYCEETHTVLADAKDGEVVIIDRFIDNRELLNYLEDLKLNIGERVKIENHASFEGPIELTSLDSGEKLNIGYKAAHYVFVRSEDK